MLSYTSNCRHFPSMFFAEGGYKGATDCSFILMRRFSPSRSNSFLLATELRSRYSLDIFPLLDEGDPYGYLVLVSSRRKCCCLVYLLLPAFTTPLEGLRADSRDISYA